MEIKKQKSKRALWLVLIAVFCLLPRWGYADALPGEKGEHHAAITEGEPSANVLDMVNALTGDFFIQQDDLVVKGVEPIRFFRSYASGSNQEKWGGWFANHLTILASPTQRIAVIPELGGTRILYDYPCANVRETKRLSVNKYYPTHGMTNCSSGMISAKTNLNNTHVQIESDKRVIRVFSASGVERYYRVPSDKDQKFGGDESKNIWHYLLRWERLPNGNRIHYTYDKYNRLSSVSTLNWKQDKVYASARFDYEGGATHHPKGHIQTSDAKELHYHFFCHRLTHPEETLLLEKVVSSEGPEETLTYYPGNKEVRPLVSARIFPHHRPVDVAYYRDRGDPQYGRVCTLYAPFGPEGEMLPAFHFSYQLGDNRYTEVTDSEGHKTLYRYSPCLRLQSKEQYLLQEGALTLWSQEKFLWEEQTGIGVTNLSCRIVYEGEKPLFARRLFYDPHGNVIEERLYGNLSGTSTPLQIDTTGLPLENGVECHIRKARYANNQLMEEEEGDKRIQYTYVEATDLLSSRLTWDKDTLRIREFLEYDEDLILVREIIDDGFHLAKDNLQGVTQRLIKETHPRQDHPFIGLPESIEEKYWDPLTQTEVLLKKTAFHYSPQGQVIQKDIYDANCALVYSQHFTYDEKGRLLQETNPLGQLSTYTYDEVGNKTSSIDCDGERIKEMRYDPANRLIQESLKDSNGLLQTTQYRYDKKNNRIATIDTHGNETRYAYDGMGNKTATYLPPVFNANKETVHLELHSQYNSLGKEIIKTDAKGEKTTYTYNIRGKPTTILHPHGAKEQFIYNLNGTLATYTDPEGTKTLYTYDFLGRETSKSIYSSQGELLSEESATYDAFHLIARKDPLGNTERFFYDGAGRKIWEEFHSSSSKEEKEYSYDNLGRLVSIRTPNSCERYLRDLLDRVVEERIEDLKGTVLFQVSYTYDPFGNKKSITRYAGDAPTLESFVYDALGQLRIHTDLLGSTTHITYNERFLNPLGQYVLQKITTDPLGIQTVETYDALNRLVSSEKKNSLQKLLSSEQFFYDANHNLSSQVSQVVAGNKVFSVHETRSEYGTGNRLLTLTEAFGKKEQKVTRYTYTLKGDLKEKMKPDGVVLRHTYNGLGDLELLQSSDGSCRYTYRYSPCHQLLEVTDLVTKESTKRTYDGRGRLLTEKLAHGSTLKSTYDARGRREEFILPDRSSIRYSYDALYLRKVTRLSSSHKELYFHTYDTYDLSGHLLQESLLGSLGRVTYTIDPLGRKSSVVAPFLSQKGEAYDAKGRLLKLLSRSPHGYDLREYAYDDLGQIIKETGPFATTFTYDSHGNRLSHGKRSYQHNALNQLLFTENASYRYDLNGNLSFQRKGRSSISYTYDALDRLREIVAYQEYRLCFTYDGLHRRMSKVSYEWHEGRWKEKDRLYFLYDDQKEIGSCHPWKSLRELRILGHAPQAEIGAAIAYELQGEVFSPIHDLFGNTRVLLSEWGHLVEAYDYSAFGESKILCKNGSACSHSAIGNPWRFSSKRLDEETGLVYYGRRYYDPSIGRWLTPDPQGFADGPNLYAFVHNDPLAHVDLYGLQSVNLWKGITQFFQFLGNNVYNFFYHLIPFPLIRDIGMAIGNFFRPQSSIIKHSPSVIGKIAGHTKPDLRIVVCNGILTPLHEAEVNATRVSKYFNGHEVHYAYNATHGFSLDILECIAGKCGAQVHASRNFAALLRQKVSEVSEAGSDARVVVIAHSQGGILLERALERLTPEERKHIKAYTFGSAAVFRDKELANLEHCVSSHDMVPFTDPIRFFRGVGSKKRGVKLVQSVKGGWVFGDHSFLGPTYQREIEQIGKNIMESY